MRARRVLGVVVGSSSFFASQSESQPPGVCLWTTKTSFCSSSAATNHYLFTREEVALNDGREGRKFYVTYKNDVYDLTEFKARHPGGNLIEQGAGGDVESFWSKWAYHFISIRQWLQMYSNRPR